MSVRVVNDAQQRNRWSTVRGRVLELLALGHSSKEICETLYLSRTALDYHVAALRDALDASNRASIVARAYNQGVLQADTWPPTICPQG
ncbi:LuxR C-terminal-related transcriptional regulator [Micromonospora sp. R77]|uniref:LuxR C-terminal-related transcriptional regulator n=1 Tax=Micromonospora sp. R77 TaxID=2925836 RepID=UPI001F60E346|nr:LuxR C-terminal-related transcriptional regulator [Micromonospora sp. R77]MCI4066227.1 LuxR C-terminal-related transcriptional regulator [Micromonospora sp. R77]